MTYTTDCKYKVQTIIFVLKLAHKVYHRMNFSFGVKKEDKSVFWGQKQTYMERHRSAHLGVRHSMFFTVLHCQLW